MPAPPPTIAHGSRPLATSYVSSPRPRPLPPRPVYHSFPYTYRFCLVDAQARKPVHFFASTLCISSSCRWRCKRSQAMGRGQQSQPAASSSSTVPKARRQWASPSRLVKLYKNLIESQNKRIRAIGFGGLLKIASRTLPAGFADWLMVECYDADSSELVLPGRERISVNVDSVCRAFGLPNNGDEVKYELDVGVINFINGEYGIDEGTSPTIESILERLKENKTSNDNFLRSWLMIAISTFLCPPTGLAISPRCYPAIVDLSCVKKLNWCQFVVDKGTAAKMGKRRSFKGCLLVLVILYVDSLLVDNVQIPSTMPRVAA